MTLVRFGSVILSDFDLSPSQKLFNKIIKLMKHSIIKKFNKGATLTSLNKIIIAVLTKYKCSSCFIQNSASCIRISVPLNWDNQER